jgi:hypothetical protein
MSTSLAESRSSDNFSWFAAFGWWFTLSIAFSFIALAHEAYQRRTIDPSALSQNGQLIPAATALWAAGILRAWQGQDVIKTRRKFVRELVTIDIVASLFVLVLVVAVYYSSIVDKPPSASTSGQSWMIFGGAAVMNCILALAATKPAVAATKPAVAATKPT